MIFRHLLAAVLCASLIAAPVSATDRKPIVLGSSGQQQQIQSGDTLSVPAAKVTGISGSTQCVQASSAGLLSGTGAACGGGGTVTTTGTPASGNLAKFSGSSSITNGDLAGDVTTSGTLTTTLSTSGVAAGTYSLANITVDAKGRVTAASSGVGGGGGSSIHGDFTEVGIGTGTTEQNLMTYSLPGGTLANGTFLRITAWGSFAANTHTRTARLYFGSTNIANTSTGSSTNTQWRFSAIVVRYGASQQRGTGLNYTGPAAAAGSVGLLNTVMTENDATTITIKITGQTGTSAANDVVADGFLIEKP